MKKRKRGNLVMGITSRVAMLVAAGLLLTSYLSIFVVPSPAWFMNLFGLLFIPFALLNFFLLLWALRRKSRSYWIPLLALLPAFIFVGRYFQFSSGGKEKNESTVKIVTYNVGNFCEGRMHTPNDLPSFRATIDSVVNFLKSADPHIV